MHWTSSNAVTLAQLIIFALVLPTFAYHALSQPPVRKAWIFFAAFSLLKIVGDALLISAAVEQSDNKTPSEGVVTAGSILSSISLAPMFLGIDIFLTQGRRPEIESRRLPPVLRILIMAATAMSLAGYLEYMTNDAFTVGSALVKVAAFLFLLVLFLLTALAFFHWRNTPSLYLEEYKIFTLALFAAFPFILVRLIYFILCAFALHSSGQGMFDYATFSLFNGSWSAKLGMLVIMEMIVAIIYSTTGFIFRSKTRSTGPQWEQFEMPENDYVKHQVLSN